MVTNTILRGNSSLLHPLTLPYCCHSISLLVSWIISGNMLPLSGLLLLWFHNMWNSTPYAAYRLEHSAIVWQLNIIGICRFGQSCYNIHCVWFATRADPPCCQFSSTYQRILSCTTTSRSDMFCAHCDLCIQQIVTCIHVRRGFKCCLIPGVHGL